MSEFFAEASDTVTIVEALKASKVTGDRPVIQFKPTTPGMPFRAQFGPAIVLDDSKEGFDSFVSIGDMLLIPEDKAKWVFVQDIPSAYMGRRDSGFVPVARTLELFAHDQWDQVIGGPAGTTDFWAVSDPQRNDRAARVARVASKNMTARAVRFRLMPKSEMADVPDWRDDLILTGERGEMATFLTKAEGPEVSVTVGLPLQDGVSADIPWDATEAALWTDLMADGGQGDRINPVLLHEMAKDAWLTGLAVTAPCDGTPTHLSYGSGGDTYLVFLAPGIGTIRIPVRSSFRPVPGVLKTPVKEGTLLGHDAAMLPPWTVVPAAEVNWTQRDRHEIPGRPAARLAKDRETPRSQLAPKRVAELERSGRAVDVQTGRPLPWRTMDTWLGMSRERYARMWLYRKARFAIVDGEPLALFPHRLLGRGACYTRNSEAVTGRWFYDLSKVSDYYSEDLHAYVLPPHPAGNPAGGTPWDDVPSQFLVYPGGLEIQATLPVSGGEFLPGPDVEEPAVRQMRPQKG